MACLVISSIWDVVSTRPLFDHMFRSWSGRTRGRPVEIAEETWTSRNGSASDGGVELMGFSRSSAISTMWVVVRYAARSLRGGPRLGPRDRRVLIATQSALMGVLLLALASGQTSPARGSLGSGPIALQAGIPSGFDRPVGSAHSQLPSPTRSIASSSGSLAADGSETEGRQAKWAAKDGPVTPQSAGESPATETAVAINPTNPGQVIVGAMDTGYHEAESPSERGLASNAIHVSTDGGQTWLDKQWVHVRDGCYAADPAVTFGASGRAYYSYIDYGCAPTLLKVMTSEDGGITWTDPTVVVAERQGQNDKCYLVDKPYIVSDPTDNTVYVTWTSFAYGCSDFEFIGSPIYFSSSGDGGSTWSAPALVSENDRDFAQASIPRVGPDGTLYVAYYHATPLSGCPSTSTYLRREPSSLEIVVASSPDGGITWSRQAVDSVCPVDWNPDQPLAVDNGLPNPTLSIDGATGNLYVAWSNPDKPSSTIKVSVSKPGSNAWSEPSSLRAGPGQSAFMPWIAAGDGLARLVYVAEDRAGLYDVYYREASDGIAWTAPVRLTTQSSCVCYWPTAGPNVQPFIGHYIGMDAAGGVVVPAWPDNRDPQGMQTIYTRVGAYAIELPPVLDLQVAPESIRGNGPIDVVATVTDPDGADTVASALLTVADAHGRLLGSWDLASFSREEDSLKLLIDDFKMSGPSPWTVSLSASDTQGLSSSIQRQVSRDTRDTQ